MFVSHSNDENNEMHMNNSSNKTSDSYHVQLCYAHYNESLDNQQPILLLLFS